MATGGKDVVRFPVPEEDGHLVLVNYKLCAPLDLLDGVSKDDGVFGGAAPFDYLWQFDY